MTKFVGLCAGLSVLAAVTRAETVAERLLAGYDSVQSVSCEIRKDIEAQAGTMRMLSRVYYQKPDRLHVDQATPVPRRIVSDGNTFYSYIEGDTKGFSRPVDKLNEEMLINLRKVPGTAMDHLMKLRGIPETNLAATAEFPVRRGYASEKVFVVLSLDATGRLARIEFYATPEMKTKTGQYDYSAFQEALPGVWIPCLHQGTFRIAGVESKETSRVDNLSVNKPIAPNLFEPGPFFKGVEFVDDFGKIYE
jgi:outer membrane lipoprotein-sorting protein